MPNFEGIPTLFKVFDKTKRLFFEIFYASEMYKNGAQYLYTRVFQVNEKQQLNPFKPEEAAIEIFDNEVNDIVLEEDAQITGIDENQIFFLINSANFTNRTGEFKIIWKLLRGDEIFFHKTVLEIRDI